MLPFHLSRLFHQRRVLFVSLALPLLLILIIVGLNFVGLNFSPLGLFSSHWLGYQQPAVNSFQQKEADSPAVKFVAEVYQLIKQHYWQSLSDEQLVDRFKLSFDVVYGPSAELEKKDLTHLKQRVAQLVENQPRAKTQQLLPQVIDYLLVSLAPRKRSRLYSKKQAKKLEQRVANINPKENYLKVLDLSPIASNAAVKRAFETKEKSIMRQATNSAQQKRELAQAKQAYEVLADQTNRQRYLKTKIEPTISGRLINHNIFYLKIKQFSPTTIADLQHVLTKQLGTAKPHMLILDLRDNVGGAIDYLPYFTGIFIGKGRYAYQFFAQGKTTNFLSQVPRLPALTNFKQTVILVNRQTQSSAEVFASVLKKYHVGVLLGETTKGWGTVERVFPLKTQLDSTQQYSIFLVHHLTLDANSLPIEGRGIKPDISIKQANWPEQLKNYGFGSATINYLQHLVKL